MMNFLFNKKQKKLPSDIRKCRFRDFETEPPPPFSPLSGMDNFFSSKFNLLYSFLGWNLPRITMSLESLHNYFGIKVKKRWTIRFFRILTVIPKYCWNDCNITVISSKFHPKNTMMNFLFNKKKKKFRPTSETGIFRDFETEPETPVGNGQFFFLKT